MATLQAGSDRARAGNDVLGAAESQDTSSIKTRLGAFKKVHAAYVAAQNKVDRTSEALRARQAEVGELDVEQDEAVMELARALVDEGLLRGNPFKPLGFDAPTVIVDLGYGVEAKVVQRLARTVLKRKASSRDSLAAAKRAEKGAVAVEKALSAVPKLEQEYRAALAARDALAQPWETAFAALRRGARAAQDDGADGLFAALFER